jgi:putative transposase
LTEIDTTGGPVEQDGPAQPGLDVHLAQELIEKARRAGVSLVGPDGLLAGVTRTVLQSALDAEDGSRAPAMDTVRLPTLRAPSSLSM